MSTITPIILISIALFSLIGGIVIISKYTPNSRQRKALIFLLSIWSLFFGLALYHHISHFIKKIDIETDILSFEMIISGTLCYMSLLFYAAITIYHKRITPYTSFILILPIFAIIIIYAIWSYITGIPINYKYTSYDELRDNMWSVPVILRFIMLALQFGYITFITYVISKLIPIYNNYMEKTQSDMRYNLKWVYTFILSLYSICIAYTTITIHLSPITETAYFIICIFSFILIIDNAIYYKTFTEYNNININWSFRGGWEIIEQSDVKEIVNSDRDYYNEIETWMINSRPYVNCNFSFYEINEKFPAINYNDLHEILTIHGHTFNSYVRQHRIDYAIKLMQASSTTQFKELYERVGFSYYSSFSRAFSSVMGESPSQYRQRTSANNS